MTTYPEKITFGEMRDSGVREVLVYCRDHRCSHHIPIGAERWPDHMRLSDIEPDFVCTDALVPRVLRSNSPARSPLAGNAQGRREVQCGPHFQIELSTAATPTANNTRMIGG